MGAQMLAVVHQVTELLAALGTAVETHAIVYAQVFTQEER